MTIYEYIKNLSVDDMASFLSSFEWYLYLYDADGSGTNLKRAIDYLQKTKNKETNIKLADDIRKALVSKIEN